MSYHHRYKLRDFDFAQQLLTLRKRTRLTQDDLALRIGVTEKAIRNWEGGTNYPTDIHLRKLTELYLDQHIFTAGHEQEEVRALWNQLRKSTRRSISSLDERWFATLLTQRQTRKTHYKPEVQGAPSHRSSSRLLRGDWSEALDVSALYGRTDELAELEQWVLRDRCRLVAVLGMGGIGKTNLAVKLVQQVAPQFEIVLWHSLHNAPSLQELLLVWIPVLSEQRYTTLPDREEHQIALLIELLQQRRCLLVFDNLETVFQKGALEECYRQGYEGYATLIQRVAETTHQSCLLLTSREQFTSLGMLASERAPVRLLRLDGLTLPASQRLLQDRGLFGEEAAWHELVVRYAGNPLMLKIVAEAVRELFGGDIAAFLAEGFTIFHGIRQLLDQQFERLSELEQALLYWLTITHERLPAGAARAGMLHPISKREVMEALHSLRCRHLVERKERETAFILQPVLVEYVTERLITLASAEMSERRPVLVHKQVLSQNQSKDYLRTSQVRLLLQPLIPWLASHLGNAQSLEAQSLFAASPVQQEYNGNILVSPLVHLNSHMKGMVQAAK